MRKLNILFVMFGLLSTCSADSQTSAQSRGYIACDTTDHLIAYYPHNVRMDLVCETMPSMQDTFVLFCAEAAFTGKLLDTFQHTNILGEHVCNGVLYDGYYDMGKEDDYGLFAAYDGVWTIAERDSMLLDAAVQHHGMAFIQHWVIRESAVYPNPIQKDQTSNFYRVIAKVNNQLCIIDSRKNIPYGLFLKALVAYGVRDALYMDMGSGWNHSFWRDANGNLHIIHPYNDTKGKYRTNWLTIYK